MTKIQNPKLDELAESTRFRIIPAFVGAGSAKQTVS
jgi:hypothetical protein